MPHPYRSLFWSDRVGTTDVVTDGGLAHCFPQNSVVTAVSLFKLGVSATQFETVLERIRRWYDVRIYGYVVMPEHVHLLVSEPARKKLSIAMQILKQLVSRKFRHADQRRFWQPRYHHSLVKDHRGHTAVLDYIHQNAMERGLCVVPEDWEWSSFRHYENGVEGAVEIESESTGRRREKMGVLATPCSSISHPSPQTGERVGHAKAGKK